MIAKRLLLLSLHSLLRTFRHRPTFLVLNTGGLALGIATFLVLASIARAEFAFDAWVPDAGRVFQLDAIYTDAGQAPSDVGGVPFRLFDGLRDAFPEIASASRYDPETAAAVLHGAHVSQDVALADPQFLDTLRYPLAAGIASALAQPDGAVLSTEAARRYFGSVQAAMGQVLSLSVNGHAMRMTVRGVLAPLPLATTTRPDMLLAMPVWARATELYTQWGMTNGQIYVRLRDASAVGALRQRMPDFIRAHAHGGNPEATENLHIDPVPLMQQHARADARQTGGAGRRQTIALLFAGVVALAAAVINAVNLLTARALLRGRETAMRKTLGASPAMLAAEALAEATVLVAIAAVPALALAEMGIPMVDALGGWAATPGYRWLVGMTVAVVVPTGCIAGIYPAFVLSRLRASAVLAAARAPAMGRLGALCRSGLVMAQFAFAVGLSVSALVIAAQSRLEARAARGFATSGLIAVGGLDAIPKGDRVAMLDAMAGVPGVVGLTTAFTLPDGGGFSSTDRFRRVDRPGSHAAMDWQDVGRNYAGTMGVRLVAGRLFDDAHRLDDDTDGHWNPKDDASRNIVVNIRATRVLGFASPQAALGAHLKSAGPLVMRDLVIVGVLDDMRLGSARDAVHPSLFFYTPHLVPYQSALIRVAHRSVRDVTVDLARVWHARAPDLVFAPQTADDLVHAQGAPERQLGRLILIGTGIAVAIAMLGVYGLASFDAARRRFEIGIRKTLGATTGRVTGLMLRRFLAPVWPACVIGSAVSFVLMRGWLAGFDLRAGLSPLYFLLCSSCAVMLCVLTVCGQTWRLARQQPATALRHD